MTMRTPLLFVAMLAVGLSGCLDSETAPSDAILDDTAVDEVADIATELFEGNTGVSFNTPVRAFNQGGAFSMPFAKAANETGYVIEVEWEATASVNEELALWIREAGAGTIPPESAEQFQKEPTHVVNGASPLRLVVAAEDLEDVEYELFVRANGEPAGVADNQPFTLHLTRFLVELDPEFTALE